MARAAWRGRRTNNETVAGEKERKRVTRLATKLVAPRGKVPQRDCSEGAVWDRASLEVTGKGSGVWAAGPALQTRMPEVRLKVYLAFPHGSARHPPLLVLGVASKATS